MSLAARSLWSLLVVAAAGCGSSTPASTTPSGTTRTTSMALVTEPPAPSKAAPSPSNPPPQNATAPMTASPAVGRDETPADRALTERIRESLVRDRALRDTPLDRVRIVATAGRINLSGVTESVVDKVMIEQRVRSVEGVEAVDNDVRIVPALIPRRD